MPRSLLMHRASEPPSTLAMLGLTDDAHGQLTAIHQRRLNQVSAIWPLAMVAQMLTIIGLTIAAAIAAPDLVERIAVLDGIALFGAAMAAAVFAPSPIRTWPVHACNRLFVAGVAAQSAGFALLTGSAIQLPGDIARHATLIALAAAIGLSALAAHPVRAATLAIGAGLLAGTALFVGFEPALGVAIVCVICLSVTIIRLARVDNHTATLREGEINQGKIAAKMIAEFEGNGTGWFWETDRQGRLTYLSDRVAEEIANGDAAPIGRMLSDVFGMDHASPGTERTLAFHLSSRTSFADYSVQAAKGAPDRRWWSISGRPSIDEMGRFQGFIGSGADLTERRRSQAEITRLALFDGLTGLANRQRMRQSLDKTLAQLTAQHRPASLLLLDLDRFKAVNDTLGHQAGDELLKQVAQRLLRVVGDDGLVGRLGGDEFKILLPGLAAREPLAALARDIIASLSQSYFIGGHSVTIGCSIGVAIAPEHGEDSETLVRNADLALYAAKAAGRGLHRFYSDDMLAGAKSRKQLEDDLRQAIATGAFKLVYQPVVRTDDARISGYEALIRWHHPTRGAISPADFVPVAEECGLIEAIGEWVLRTACQEAACWPGDVRVAVNVSPIQFANPNLPNLVANALARAGLAPARLELEITEGVFLNETQSSDQMFRALKGLGIRLALDDFGTGYSSLGYLRTAPFDKIKIDQSFVRGAAQPGNRNAAIIKAIVTLADTLGMETTAEGVEIQDEIDLVRTLGCSHIQGYVYGRPADAQTVRGQLGVQGGRAAPSGFKVSRAPRTRMLRSARIAIDGIEGDVRIRDISVTGAMIDGIEVAGDTTDLDLLIEIVEDQMIQARVRWAEDGRAGLQFAEPFDLGNLAQPIERRGFRRTA